MDIIQFSSGSWPAEEFYGLVGHSYRVMAKAKNLDELVVGLMHGLHAASSTTRWRYRQEMIRGDYEWTTALDLFVPPLPERRFKARETVPDEYLLSLNMPRFLSEAERDAWMLEQTTFTAEYGDYIWKNAGNRIARNVMIHKLEQSLFGRNTVSDLDQEQKTELVRQLRRRFSSDVRQIARVTSLPMEEAARLLDAP